MSAIKRILFATAAIIALLVLYLLAWPTAVEPVAWEAPVPPELSGKYAVNHALRDVERLEIDLSYGPEDVDIDSLGRIYGSLHDGQIIRLQPDGSGAEVFANTEGRPLGLHFDPHGNLIVADAYKGLLAIDTAGSITVLSTSADGVPFRFTDDVDIAADGTIYFSDASHKFYQSEYRLDAIEHRPNGRLLAYDPETRETAVLLKDLYFANGVAVSPDQQFVLVNETWKYRVTRYWLAGEKVGTTEVFINNLPGFPDGISSDGKETFWLALASPRNPMIDNLSGKPFLRKIISRLPQAVQPDAIPYAFVLGLDMAGNVVHNLQSPSGKPYSFITSVEAHGDMLYFGSLIQPAIARIQAPGE